MCRDIKIAPMLWWLIERPSCALSSKSRSAQVKMNMLTESQQSHSTPRVRACRLGQVEEDLARTGDGKVFLLSLDKPKFVAGEGHPSLRKF